MRNQIVLAGILVAFFFVTRSISVNAAEGEIVKLDKAQFKTLIMDFEKNTTWKFQGKLPCIVDFYADWCGPCRTASPILEELARKYKGKIVVYKVNTDQERELGTIFHISSIPAFLWVPRTGEPKMTSGIARTPDATREQFEKIIQEMLLK